MTKTLIVVLTHAEASPILEMNWPWLLKAGTDIAIVTHEGDEHQFAVPRPQLAYTTGIGKNPNDMPHRWVTRFMGVLEWCLTTDYRSFCIVESDVIFVRPLPAHPGGLVATLAGYRSDVFHGSKYWHCPWWVSHRTAQKIVRWGKAMLGASLDELGFVDRFIGLMADLYPLQIIPAPFYSRNTILPQHYAEARSAFIAGAYGAHGIKTPQILAAITDGLNL